MDHRGLETTDANTIRRNAGTFGTTTSSLVYGGQTPSITNITESWNGSAWTEVSDLNANRTGLSSTGAGVSNTSGMMASGLTLPPYSSGTGNWGWLVLDRSK